MTGSSVDPERIRSVAEAAVAANDALFESDDRVHTYDASLGLTAAEETLIRRWIPRGADILDLGVGTGRTVAALSSIAGRYVGLDYSVAMVRAASERFEHVDLVQGDAADLARFEDESFDAVVFSYNGLDYLAPYDRRARALAEIRRVLRRDGVFLMSTHNPRGLVRTPPAPDRNVRAVAASVLMTARAVAARGFSPVTVRGAGYHRDHVQGLHTYFATADRLIAELSETGFATVDMLGGDHPRPRHTLTSPWTYVAAVPRTRDVSVSLETFPGVGSRLAETWDRMAQDTGCGPFQTRQWVSAWHATLEPDARLALLVARAGENVVGLLPVARLQRSVHRSVALPLPYVGIAGSGTGAGDHLGPITSRVAVGAALFEALVDIADGHSVLLESLDPRWGAVAAAAIKGRIVSSTPCPASTRRPGGSFQDAWSTKARKNARRRARMLAREGVSAHWTSPGPGFPGALRDLRSLHGERWSAAGQAGLFPPLREAFLNAYASTCTPDAGPWILTLKREDAPVAALLGIRFRDTFYVYKTGWSPDVAKLGPGMALGQEAMRWAEEHGLHTFDYLRGPGFHKAELGCIPRHDVSVLRSHGMAGYLLAVRERPTHPLRTLLRRASTRRRG